MNHKPPRPPKSTTGISHGFAASNLLCEPGYKQFDALLNRSVRSIEMYILDKHDTNIIVNQVAEGIQFIFRTNKDCFEYIMEKYHSHSRNPFTSAYSEIMNYIDSGLEEEYTFVTIAKNILRRELKERGTNNKYIVF